MPSLQGHCLPSVNYLHPLTARGKTWQRNLFGFVFSSVNSQEPQNIDSQLVCGTKQGQVQVQGRRASAGGLMESTQEEEEGCPFCCCCNLLRYQLFLLVSQPTVFRWRYFLRATEPRSLLANLRGSQPTLEALLQPLSLR